MARIFFWQADGTIYGVHPGPHDPEKVTIPSGVVWLDTLEAPDQISWPLRGGLAGREQWSRVVSSQLVLRSDLPPLPIDRDARLKVAIQAVDSTLILDPAAKQAVERIRTALIDSL